MLKNVLLSVINSLFHKSSPKKLALATSLGLALGFLPNFGVRAIMTFVFSVVFRLNIIALILGSVITFAFYELPYFGIHYFSFIPMKILIQNSRSFFYNSAYGVIWSFLAYPLLKLFYSWGISEETVEQNYQDKIFHDVSGKRSHLIQRFILLVMGTAFIIMTIFAISLYTNPTIPNLGLQALNKLNKISPITQHFSEGYLVSILKAEDKLNPTFQLDFRRHHQLVRKAKINQNEVYAFYVNWDENSFTSFKQHLRSISTLVPEWYHLNSDLTISNEYDKKVDRMAKNNKLKVMPLINNFSKGKWDTQSVHQVLTSPKARNSIINALYNEVKKYNYGGINIDFEEVQVVDQDNYTTFIAQLSKLFHSGGYKVTVDLPPNSDVFDYGKIAEYADRVIVMLYDEHDEFGSPGPVASQKWYQQSLESLDIPPQKLIVSLGNYGYDWNVSTKDRADSVTYSDVIEMASSDKLKINWDSKSENPYYMYADGSENHIVWFLDAVTLFNQVQIAKDNDIRGVAMWRLGSEDPDVWKILRNSSQLPQQAAKLQRLTNPQPTHYSGAGEVLRIISAAQAGKRSVSLNNQGLIDHESYDILPKPFEIMRYGKPATKEVVLTFDDGPDPQYTPQILGILKKYKIKGTFFVVGENVDANPELLQRTYREGNEIGSHTYTHPNVAEVSPWRTKMELNANQRLIQELTGHSVTMFRPPYVADAEPSTPNELLPILRAQDMGYTMIGELIDPEDWQRPSSKEILNRVMQQLPLGNVILLHDAGGDRSNTVKALPMIIKTLEKKGYKFVTIGELIGKKPLQLMPPVQPGEGPFLAYDRAVFAGMTDWQHTITALFYFAIGLGIFRFIFLIFYASRQRKKYKLRTRDPKFKPFVSVVIAAYNEEKVISNTIKSILASDYPNFEIVVVDDGSTDQTARTVEEDFKCEPKIKVYKKENGGKSSAVNWGFKKATGEFIVALDADTIIAKDAIALLVGYFVDPQVAAVSGNVKVGNVHNLLTLWQHVEYVTGFNLERRAFDDLNCITVVPGAIGAWRKKAVEQVGYFNDETLAEDTDITLTLLRNGYHIAYEEKAFAYTESPADIKSLLKQRFRWSFGTLQCLWKHRGALFNKKYNTLGFIALPNMWLFQYLFQSMSPLADIFFVLGLFSNEPKKILAYYLVFFAIDLLASLYAFRLDNENPKPLIWLFLQRIVYRQFMTYVVLKSFVYALNGATVGWNKLKRIGNVEGNN